MIITGDCREVLKTLEKKSVQTCVTSPPYYGLRDYGHADQIGQEISPRDYVTQIVKVFREVWDVLKDDGTLWLNLGDSYYNYRPGKGQSLVKQSVSKTNQDLPQKCSRRAEKLVGLKEKDLIGIPWRVAFALQDDGWTLRQDIIWSKPNPMPESVTDRCTKAHEYIFMLSKSPRYYYDQKAIKEPAIYAGLTGQEENGYKNAKKFNGKHSDKQRGHSRRHAGFNERWDKMEKTEQCSGMRNKRSVWEVATRPYAEAHFATFPPQLIEPCIRAGSAEGDIVLDPFNGSGTTGAVALQWKRKYIGIELNPDYVTLSERRMKTIQTEMFA